MITSGRIQHLHELFSGIIFYEWILFLCGILAGIALWILFYHKIVKQLFSNLEKKVEIEVLKIFVQCTTGAVIIFPNILLLNYGELNRNFLLWALGATGILFGVWIFIPAEKNSN